MSLKDLANPYCDKCGGAGTRNNGYFNYPCNCVRIKPLDIGTPSVVRDSGYVFKDESPFIITEIKEVFVVLHEDSENKSITVLDAYTDEEKANSRVAFERGMTGDNVWYQSSDLKQM